MTNIAKKLHALIVAKGGRLECAKTYRPAVTLVREGYAKWVYENDKIYLELIE